MSHKSTCSDLHGCWRPMHTDCTYLRKAFSFLSATASKTRTVGLFWNENLYWFVYGTYCENFHLMWVVFSKSGKRTGKHITSWCCCLWDLPWRSWARIALCLTLSTVCFQGFELWMLEGWLYRLTVISFIQHCTGGTIDDFYHFFRCIIYGIIIHFTVLSVNFFQLSHGCLTFTRLCHTTFEAVGLPLTIMYNSRSGKDCSPLLDFLTWFKVSFFFQRQW